ncbi:CidA/LrgA family protein [Geomonas subterranea]|uniref:CidA/LrgA family protein n=1 Tax=Geomonas subterranea TaxID=2847989 RepID=A0ABX8LQY7_9BACT|nr:CidA/LrgA family protein [Geomonas subterranea]QXE92663.1 CidA/LrgA family protein [Geomonas subterranea]QXM09238.1 CidA/LrgA family protein [Geomonas subterranea]
MAKSWVFARQVVILCVIYWIGNLLASSLHIPVPGNVVGVCLLFALLSLGVLKLDDVQTAADFLIKHLMFFFIPIAVDLMNWGTTFYLYGLALVAAIIVSTALTLLSVGYTTQFIEKGKVKCQN